MKRLIRGFLIFSASVTFIILIGVLMIWFQDKKSINKTIVSPSKIEIASSSAHPIDKQEVNKPEVSIEKISNNKSAAHKLSAENLR